PSAPSSCWPSGRGPAPRPPRTRGEGDDEPRASARVDWQEVQTAQAARADRAAAPAAAARHVHRSGPPGAAAGPEGGRGRPGRAGAPGPGGRTRGAPHGAGCRRAHDLGAGVESIEEGTVTASVNRKEPE